jgi:hypothetical protein
MSVIASRKCSYCGVAISKLLIFQYNNQDYQSNLIVCPNFRPNLRNLSIKLRLLGEKEFIIINFH